MDRRDLLKKLAIGAPAMIAAPLLASITSGKADSPDDFMYHGWRVRWSGWVMLSNVDAKIGRWVAYPPERSGWQLYSSWPGKCGNCTENYTFDCSLQKWQTLPTDLSTPDDLEHYKSECLERLKRLIVKAGPPPLKEKVWLD